MASPAVVGMGEELLPPFRIFDKNVDFFVSNSGLS